MMVGEVGFALSWFQSDIGVNSQTNSHTLKANILRRENNLTLHHSTIEHRKL